MDKIYKLDGGIVGQYYNEKDDKWVRFIKKNKEKAVREDTSLNCTEEDKKIKRIKEEERKEKFKNRLEEVLERIKTL